MKLPYYPGCTLKANAKHFEDSAIKALSKLDYELEEMKDWVCCGTVFSLTNDDLMLHISSIRNLLRAEEQNFDRLVVLCSMCYNTLNRSNKFITENPENLEKLNDFMYKENIEYNGNLDIVHLLSVIKDEITFKEMNKKLSKPLKNLKIGAYYGCLLVRPQEFAIDNFEAPTIMEDLIENLEGKSIDFPYKLECCGAYQTITKKDISVKRAYEILKSAQESGCEAVVTSCPLCAYNLDFLQEEIEKEFGNYFPIPVFYFTELMALALDGNWQHEWTQLHKINPEPLLKEKNLI